MKYDKWACLQYDQDDGGAEFYNQVFPYFNGGVAADGITYPGLGYTDGAGGPVKYRATGVIYGINTFNNTEIAGGTDASKFTYAQMAAMIRAGWDLSNHSLYHTDGPDYAGQVIQLNSLIKTRLAAYGLAYDLRTAVVPTDYAGFVEAFFDNGMISVSSQGTGAPTPCLARTPPRRCC